MKKSKSGFSPAKSGGGDGGEMFVGSKMVPLETDLKQKNGCNTVTLRGVAESTEPPWDSAAGVQNDLYFQK